MTPRTPEQFENIREERKQEILDAALPLFARNGFNNTSISQITREAGISKGLIYNYFNSKEQLVKEVIWNAMHKIPSVFNMDVDIEDDPIGMLNSLFEEMKITAQKDKTFWKLYMDMFFHLIKNPELLKELQNDFEYLFDNFQKLFAHLGFEDPVTEMLKFSATIDGVLLNYIAYEDFDYPLEKVIDSIHRDLLRNIQNNE